MGQSSMKFVTFALAAFAPLALGRDVCPTELKTGGTTLNPEGSERRALRMGGFSEWSLSTPAFEQQLGAQEQLSDDQLAQRRAATRSSIGGARAEGSAGCNCIVWYALSRTSIAVGGASLCCIRFLCSLSRCGGGSIRWTARGGRIVTSSRRGSARQARLLPAGLGIDVSAELLQHMQHLESN